MSDSEEQGNLRKHPVVANQEDTPTGESSGKYPLPRPCSVPAGVAFDLKESNSSLVTNKKERICTNDVIICHSVHYIMNVFMTVPWKL